MSSGWCQRICFVSQGTDPRPRMVHVGMVCMMEPGGLWWGCPALQGHISTPRTARRVRILAKISLIWVAVMLRS